MLACVAVMFAFPAPTMVTILSLIVATVKSELVYVKSPSRFEVGGTNVNVAEPNVFAGTEKLVRTVVI